jgi:hypothetical protein
MSSCRRTVTAVVLMATVAGVSACGDRAAARPAAAVVTPLGNLPAVVAGYRVHPEDVRSQLRSAGRHAYVDAVKLWSLREGTYLRATVEVARFAADAPIDDPHFRATVAGQLATSSPVERHLTDGVVYVTTGDRQIFYVWFRGRQLFVVTIPTTTPRPRAILRVLLREAKP